MTKKIFKYHLPMGFHSTSDILVPRDFKPLRVDVQNQDLYIWAIVDPETPEQLITVTIVGTGGEPPVVGEYLNTIFAGGIYVFHAFIDQEV